jgi:phenylacetate-coenzyme A ligase PaaK-like adenylate-forming protein
MMDRSDVAALADRSRRDLEDSDSRCVMVRVTSGTTGAPLVISEPIDSRFDPEEPSFLGNMLACLGSRNARLACVLIARADPNVSRILALDASELDAPIGRCIGDFAPDAVHGFYSMLARAAARIPPKARSRVAVLRCTGEGISADGERFLFKRFPHARHVQIYIASEVGGIGRRSCRHLFRNRFHPASGVAIDIVDHDEDGIGDILVSKSISRSVRIDRYRIGDMGRYVPEVCPCGAPVTFELHGRRGIDYIKLNGVLLTRAEFDRVVAQFSGYIDDYRVDALRGSGDAAAKVVLRVYQRAGARARGSACELAGKISRSLFVTQTRTFNDLVIEGVLAPLEVEFADKPFARGFKDVKLRMRPA